MNQRKKILKKGKETAVKSYILLTKEDGEILAHSLLHPAKPNECLKELAARYERKIQELTE